MITILVYAVVALAVAGVLALLAIWLVDVWTRKHVLPAGADIRPFMDWIAGGVAGGANVVMQLARPEVAYGVMESKWERGSITHHPFKRARTTATYLAVALAGTEKDREVFREAVNRAHQVVKSTEKSPVQYNAFSPEQQMWVAACLFYGPFDYYKKVYGEPDPAAAEVFYRHASRLGTTLQVRPDQWPENVAAFERYWDEAVSGLKMDEKTAEFARSILHITFMPWYVRWPMGRLMAFVNTGFLPQPFRDMLGVTWTEGQEKWFRRLLGTIHLVQRLTPGPLRRVGIHAVLWDMRVRNKLGWQLT